MIEYKSDPFGLFYDKVSIIYRAIYNKNNEKIGVIGLIFEINYLRLLVDSSLTENFNVKYLVYDHHAQESILTSGLALNNIFHYTPQDDDIDIKPKLVPIKSWK